MYKLLLLICIGILPDIAMAHALSLSGGRDNCRVPLTVLSGNVECKLTDFHSGTIKCKIVKFSHITYTFNRAKLDPSYYPRTYVSKNGVPTESYIKLAMTSVCIKDNECYQAFDCDFWAATDGDGCHINMLTTEDHCH